MDNNKPMTINVSWAGITKTGKWKCCDQSIGGEEGDPKKKWFLAGQSFNPVDIVKGKKYDVMVGVDQYGNQYINAMDEGGKGMADLSSNKPVSTPSETKKPDMIEQAKAVVADIKKSDIDLQKEALTLACIISEDWETAKALAETSIFPYLRGLK